MPLVVGGSQHHLNMLGEFLLGDAFEVATAFDRDAIYKSFLPVFCEQFGSMKLKPEHK